MRLSIGGYTVGRDRDIVLRTLAPAGARDRSRSASGCRAAPPARAAAG